ncbi:MAG: tetratricopeptide repeat protein [Elusimicrobia bacterium]|nr:tetratricopeptide repeat protein [Elusimicrobiota bacterium]
MKRTILTALAVCLFAAGVSAAADKEAYLHFMNGMVLERQGNYDSALQEYKRTLLLDPQSVFVYKQALNLALRVGKVEDASRWADFVVKSDSSTADNWVLYGNVRWASGDMPGAGAAYERAAALDENNHEAFYQLASLWSSRDPDRSVGYLKKYLELKPDDAAEINYQIAVLHNMKGRYEEMKRSLLKSKEADAYYLQPRYMLANYYETKNDTAAALGEYSELLELESGNVELYDHVGELYASPAVSRLDEAEKYFLKAWELAKSDPVACFWLSVISEQRRDFPGAAAYLEGSSGLKDDAGLTLRLAYYYTQSGCYDKAIAMLETSAKRWPDNSEIAYFLALGYDDTGKTEKARAALRALLAKDPDHAEARMQYAVISEREGDMPAAEESFRRLLAKDPGNANVLNYLGYSLADRGLKLEEAEALISSAVAKEPLNGAYMDSMAWVKFRRGDLAAARAGIKKAVGIVYDDPVIWAHAGEIYEAGGDYRTAWLAWKNSRLLDKPAKRAAADSHLKALQKKIPAAEADGLQRAYLGSFLPAGQEFSSFAKVEARLRGRTVKFDAILHFSPPQDFSLTVMGPLMAPLWRARFSGGGLEMDSMELKEIDPGAFNYWAALITGELRDWFSGRTLAGGRLDGGWGANCFSGGGKEVCLDDDGTPAEVRPDSERKLHFLTSRYFMRNLYLFPYVMEFELPRVSLKLTLDAAQMNFNGVNKLSLPD